MSCVSEKITNLFACKLHDITAGFKPVLILSLHWNISESSPYNIRSKNKTPFWGNAIPVFGVETKRVWYVFWLFFRIGLCSAISFIRSRRELSIDVAEHRSTLKIYQNTHYPRFSFIPKSDIPIPNGGFVFTVLFIFEIAFK